MTCNCLLDVAPELIKAFLIHMMSAQPIFGFACEPQERDQRNRINTKQGINNIESWVGRDPQNYIPGLYWWTILPNALAEKHRVPLAAIKPIALEHVRIEGGQNLFRFYEKPDGWRAAQGIDTMRLSQPGIFDVEEVRPLALAARTFLELGAVDAGLGPSVDTPAFSRLGAKTQPTRVCTGQVEAGGRMKRRDRILRRNKEGASL